jgi:hypothetical protein
LDPCRIKGLKRQLLEKAGKSFIAIALRLYFEMEFGCLHFFKKGPKARSMKYYQKEICKKKKKNITRQF